MSWCQFFSKPECILQCQVVRSEAADKDGEFLLRLFPHFGLDPVQLAVERVGEAAAVLKTSKNYKKIYGDILLFFSYQINRQRPPSHR